MKYLEYDGEPLKLDVSVRSRERAACLYVDNISRAATHIMVYRRERGARGSLFSLTALGSPYAEYECGELLHHAGREIPVDGAMMEYCLFPAVYRDGDFYLDTRAVCRVEAGAKIELSYTVTRVRENSKSERLTISLYANREAALPYDRLFYRIAEIPGVRFPLDREMIRNARFTIYTPKGYRVSVGSLDNANISVREG